MSEFDKTDCASYDTCKKYAEEGEELHCEDCDNYMPTDCFEDSDGKKPFYMLVQRKKVV